MKFEILYLIAKLRGLFPDNQKGTFVYGRPNKKVVKEMYKGRFLPYRIDSLVTFK